MRLLTGLFLVCLSIDFSNPLLPGAVRFDDGETVHGDHADRPRLGEQSLRQSLRASAQSNRLPADQVLDVSPPPPSSEGVGRRPLFLARRPRPDSPDPSSTSAEDH